MISVHLERVEFPHRVCLDKVGDDCMLRQSEDRHSQTLDRLRYLHRARGRGLADDSIRTKENHLWGGDVYVISTCFNYHSRRNSEGAR